MSEVTKCPHCEGELVKAEKYLGWQYECKRCGRVWIVLDGIYWLAGFDAGGHVYEIRDGVVIDHNSFKDEELREKLWNRVRK